jgi:hypothetical protein
MSATFQSLVLAARKSCQAFSTCSASFFDLTRRPNNWAGWENWLTVDIVRQLNCKEVLPFLVYPGSQQKLDLYIESPKKIAVEIKVNYLTDGEIDRSEGERPLPQRVENDIRKLASLPKSTGQVMLVATCFQSRRGLKVYPALVKNCINAPPFRRYSATWYECSRKGGATSLLVLAKSVS